MKANLKDQESVYVFDEDGLFVGKVTVDSPGYDGRTTLAFKFPSEFALVRGSNLTEANRQAMTEGDLDA